MLHACPACGCHCRATEVVCPHCAAAFVATASRTAAVVLMGLTLAGCPPGSEDDTAKRGDTAVVTLYGVIDTASNDDDGDGWSERDGDCADDDATRHPEATETAGDGVDSNCDGEDDT